MTTEQPQARLLERMLELLELPASAYETATKRYEDIGEWFEREESVVSENDPHIFSQGSFRLGTAIRPLDANEAYDLDLACKLRTGITKDSHTQEQLKVLVGCELELYRNARGISQPLEPKHRCWRLEYQDNLSFHMDIVPCIPADETRRTLLKEASVRAGLDRDFAETAISTTVDITDDRHPNYRQIVDDWHISNPEGYGAWFEKRMRVGQELILNEKYARVDPVPLFRRKTPLQRVVQLLKRHRDCMFRQNGDSKPISIIITTLAARAYQGEYDIVGALQRVLADMDQHVQPSRPRVPKPVDPNEDFADRWYFADSRHLRLEENFKAWLAAARRYFQQILEETNPRLLHEQIEDRMDLHIPENDIKTKLGLVVPSIVTAPRIHTIDPANSARPWRPSRQ